MRDSALPETALTVGLGSSGFVRLLLYLLLNVFLLLLHLIAESGWLVAVRFWKMDCGQGGVRVSRKTTHEMT